MHPSEAAPSPDQADGFYSGVLRRISRYLIVLSLPSVIAALLFGGLASGLGVLAGAAVAFINFQSLARAVDALGERITTGSSRESGGRILFRLLLRYLVIAAVAYGIFKGSRGAFLGFLGGLALPVAAFGVEAAYEAYIAFRRA